MGIKRELKKIQGETLRAQVSVKERIEFWKTHSLKESLYNDGKTPRPQDVAQMTTRKFSSYGLEDCYLLANLINIAKNNPKIITNDMLIPDGEDIKVRLFDSYASVVNKEKFLEDPSSIPLTCKFESGKQRYYIVKRKEVLELVPKTHHKALWPLVIEIAYAKHVYQTYTVPNARIHFSVISDMMDDDQKSMLPLLKNQMKTEKIENLTTYQLLNLIYNAGGGGVAAMNYTELTGLKSKFTSYAESKIFSKSRKFPENASYSEQAKKIYEKIEKKLSQNKDITVGFKGFGKVTDYSPGKITPQDYALELSGLRDDQMLLGILLECFTKNPIEWYMENKDKYHIKDIPNSSELGENSKYDMDSKSSVLKKARGSLTTFFHQLEDKDLLQYIIDCMIFEKMDASFKEISSFKNKGKRGIYNMHAYAVVGCFEHEGYKYLVLQNTHDRKTKIDYTKSKNLPPKVKLPTELPKGLTSRNQCMMELNHFCKHLHAISYS